MRNYSRVIVAAGCLVVLLISWVVVITAKSDVQRQLELMDQAAAYIKDGAYVPAVPLLEEAAGYSTARTSEIETELKRVYLALIDQRGYRRRYISLLETQMNRRNASPDVFAEAAIYYLGVSQTDEALETLRNGIERTGSEELTELYEKNRYTYEMSRTSYDYVAAICGNTVQVRTDGLWGIARANGIPLIPCEYEQISTFSVDRAIVRQNGEIFAVDGNNNRVAMLHEAATDFGNYADNRIPFLIDGRWHRSTGELAPGTAVFEQIGMYSGGYAAARTDGKWGVIGTGSNWLIPADYDEILQDELGRCYAQGAVFARIGDAIFLLVGGRQVGEVFEDARPFSEEGYAAVRRNGKWGFIDTNGTVMIDFIFEDALSFGQHLAAVRIDGLWGYISIYGRIAIEPVFIEAKSFSGGSAPVLTQRGWQFITLLEYMRRAKLL